VLDSRLRSWLPLGAALLLCALIIGPGLDVYPELATGDHGRDLYAAEAALRGEWPYRDYIWQYGPIMPFYYAAFVWLFGVSAQSVLLGATLLRAGTALAVFAILRRRTTPVIALLGCWWLLLFHREFPHTFAHGGALTCLALLTWLLLRYADDARPRDLFVGCALGLVLLLQKLNFGLIGLGALAAGAAFVEWRSGEEGRRGRLLAATGIPLAALFAAAVYAFMLVGLPDYAIRQSLPYLPEDRVRSLAVGEGLAELAGFYAKSLVADPHTVVGTLVVLGGLSVWLPSLRRPGALESRSTRVLLAVGVLYVLSMHEFVLSGFSYRLRWADVFATLLTMLLVHRLYRALPSRSARGLLVGLALFCAISTAVHWTSIAEQRDPSRFLDHERLRIHTKNEAPWRDVVERTAAYLEEHVAPDERFFAIPYDALYYYLAGQPTPTRSIMLFEFMNVSEQQELDIIADLERENVRWIVCSNRAWAAKGDGLGQFGETHAQNLAAWIDEQFEPVAEIGDQEHKAYWIGGHATRIYRRRDEPGSERRERGLGETGHIPFRPLGALDLPMASGFHHSGATQSPTLLIDETPTRSIR